MQTIDPEEMRSRMLSLDAAREKLAFSEGLAEHEFATDGRQNTLTFHYRDGWNEAIDDKQDWDAVDASVTIDGTDISLTKNGALDLASEVGLPKASAKDTPGEIVNNYLNYHYSHGARGKGHLKLLSARAGGLALTRGSVTPYSNTALLDSVVSGISDRFSIDPDELMVDYKFAHDLDNTQMRIILPSTKNIDSVRSRKGGVDSWSLGIELNNSLTGAKSLELRGYTFAWWCTNGATIQHASSGKYRRKSTVSPDEAYRWAQSAVNDVLNDLTPTLDDVETLTKIPLEGELNDTLAQTFDRFSIPANLREPIIHNLVENDDLSAYGLLASLSEAANHEGLSATAVDRLLVAGGDFAHEISNRCPTCHSFANAS